MLGLQTRDSFLIALGWDSGVKIFKGSPANFNVQPGLRITDVNVITFHGENPTPD